jgi:pimeloyl-ACP methyl ester carboxylesterase
MMPLRAPRPGQLTGEGLEMVSTFVLIHGAGDGGWYRHLVEAELRAHGHDVVTPDLPADDESAGLTEYADTVVAAVGDRTGLVVVGQSFGAFTAPLVADRLPADVLGGGDDSGPW